uniref:Integrator complex subunit 7-like C-terminal domain-containing protein n=1 Tax=Oryza barthii TaxID=65489 RepID=A0A0D3EIM4_9ORYZ
MGRRGIQPQPKKRRLVFLCLVVQPRALLSSVGPTPPLEERGERGEGAKQPNSRGGGRRPPPRIRPTPSPLVAVSRSKSSARRRHAAAALLLRAAPPLGGERRGWCAGERIPPLGAVAPPSLHHCLVRRRRRLRAPGSLRWGEGREGGERGESGIPGTPKCGDTPKCGEWLVGVGAHHLHSITRSNRGPTVSRKKHKKKKKGYRRAAAAASAMAMQWSIDLDRALRSRHPTPVGKQIVLGTLEDNFKADMLLSLSRLASKSVLLFGDQVELLLLFLEHESSHCMKTVSLKCLCFMFHGSICHFPVLRTVFGTLLQLIDDDDFPLDCKRDAFTVLQKIVCGKAPIVHFVDTSELSKLVLAAESSLHSSSWEMQELARLDDSDCSKVSVANVESFQTYSAREVLGTSNDIKPETASVMASHMGADFDKLKFDPTEFSSKKEVFIVRNIILSTLKFANTCHNMLSKTPGASCNLYDRIKELIECVQQNASQYCSTYEFFHLIMCACISWYACKTRDGNQESGDPTEQPDIFFSPSIWLTQELCAIRITKMLFRKQSSLAGSSELHGSQAKITDICSKTFLATDHLLSNTSSSHELFFQRWFISLRASFLEILADFLGILTAHLTDQRDESHHDAIGDHSSVPREHNNSQLLALVNCSLRLSELAHSYDLLAVSHGDMDRQSFSSIARLAFMCSLLAFCIAFSVDFSKIVTRMNCSGILEKDSYRLCKFAVAYFLRLRGDTKGIATGEYSVSPLHGGMQFLSSILQRVMELPFVLPKYFFRVRPCFGAELHIYDSNPENRDGISVPSGLQLSLTLCLQWKCVLERSNIDISKLLEAILRFSCKLSILLLRCNRNKKQRV